MGEEVDREKERQAILHELELSKKSLEERGEQPWFLNNLFLKVYDNSHRQMSESSSPNRRKLHEIIDTKIKELGLEEEVKQLLAVSYRAFQPTDTEEDFKYTTEQRLQAAAKLEETLIPLYIELRLMGFSRGDLVN